MSSADPILSLRVHRVVPRNTGSLDFLTSSEKEVFFAPEESEDGQEEMSPEYVTEWQFLPRSYGQIYLGEMFSFYVKTSNDSEAKLVTDLCVRIDLQVATRVINLCDSRREELPPGQAFHQLIHHEIKEMGGNV